MHRWSLLILLVSTLFAACGQLLLKVGAHKKLTFVDFVNTHILFGLAFYVLSTILWIYVLSKEELIHVYAFTALTFVLVYTGGVVFLGETLRTAAIIGVLFVLSGLYLIVSE